jgi:hypothetical protein
MKYTHWLADNNKVTQYEFMVETVHRRSKGVLILRTISRQNQKTDITAQLYCTLSTYLTPKTISRQNQKPNTRPHLYSTLRTQVCKTKTYFPPEPKTVTTAQLENKVPSAHMQQVYLFLCLSFCLSVRAKRGIWSKKVLIKKIGNFSFSVR